MFSFLSGGQERKHLYTTVIEHHTSHDMSAAPVTSSPAVWDKGHTVQCTTSADYVIHFYHNNFR